MLFEEFGITFLSGFIRERTKRITGLEKELYNENQGTPHYFVASKMCLCYS